MQEIVVSIICTAYNHEKYIKKCLEGFVMQKTNFAFEVLINDDCSTDDTAKIIKEYEEKYPNIIKPIYQAVNQYSQGINITKDILLPKVKGKYIALCEGDDCWIDENKLQIQVDYMENNPKCTFCFTNAIVNNLNNNKKYYFIEYFNCNKYIKYEDYDLGQLNKLKFIPTCSFLFPTANYNKFPNYFNDYCFGGDRKISMFSTALGYAHFIDKKTCEYNYCVLNSAMTISKTNNQTTNLIKSYINLAINLNQFTKNNYKNNLFDYILKQDINLLYFDYKNLIKVDYYKKLYKLMPLKMKMKLTVKKIIPQNILDKVKNARRKAKRKDD